MENQVPLADRTVERSVERQYSAARREIEALMAAAERLVEREGSEEPRISDILREAGLSNKAFYRHFRSKDELLITVLDDGLRADMRRITEAMEAEASPVRRVETWIRGLLSRLGDQPTVERTRSFFLSGLRLGVHFPKEWSETDEILQAPLRQAIDDARSAGQLPAADPDRDARTIARLVLGELQFHLIGRQPMPPEDVDRLVAFCLGGLGLASAPARE